MLSSWEKDCVQAAFSDVAHGNERPTYPESYFDDDFDAEDWSRIYRKTVELAKNRLVSKEDHLEEVGGLKELDKSAENGGSKADHLKKDRSKLKDVGKSAAKDSPAKSCLKKLGKSAKKDLSSPDRLKKSSKSAKKDLPSPNRSRGSSKSARKEDSSPDRMKEIEDRLEELAKMVGKGDDKRSESAEGDDEGRESSEGHAEPDPRIVECKPRGAKEGDDESTGSDLEGPSNSESEESPVRGRSRTAGRRRGRSPFRRRHTTGLDHSPDYEDIWRVSMPTGRYY